jgi:hypothetical protein
LAASTPPTDSNCTWQPPCAAHCASKSVSNWRVAMDEMALSKGNADVAGVDDVEGAFGMAKF